MKHSNGMAAWTSGIIAGLSVLVILWPAEGLAQEKETAKTKETTKAAAKTPVWEDFTVVVNQNMFSKNRIPPVDRTRPIVRMPDPNAESLIVLRGIASEDGVVFLALLQDGRGGVWKRVGDEVARGKIKSINLDSIEFQMGDSVKTIEIGCNLEGARGAAASRSMPSGGMAGGPGPGEMRGPGGSAGMRFNDMMSGGRSRSRFGGFDNNFNRQSFNRRDRAMTETRPAQGATTNSASSSSEMSTEDPAAILRALVEERQRLMGQPSQVSDQTQQTGQTQSSGQAPSSGQNQQQPGQDQQQTGQSQ